MKTKEEVLAFLKRLTDLSSEYGLIIGGCGCCGSPYLTEEVNDDIRYRGHYRIDNNNSNLEWVDSTAK